MSSYTQGSARFSEERECRQNVQLSRDFDASWQMRLPIKYNPLAGQRVRQTPGALLMIWFSFHPQKIFPFEGRARATRFLSREKNVSVSRLCSLSICPYTLRCICVSFSSLSLSLSLLLELQIIPAINDELEACTILPRRSDRRRICG